MDNTKFLGCLDGIMGDRTFDKTIVDDLSDDLIRVYRTNIPLEGLDMDTIFADKHNAVLNCYCLGPDAMHSLVNGWFIVPFEQRSMPYNRISKSSLCSRMYCVDDIVFAARLTRTTEDNYHQVGNLSRVASVSVMPRVVFDGQVLDFLAASAKRADLIAVIREETEQRIADLKEREARALGNVVDVCLVDYLKF